MFYEGEEQSKKILKDIKGRTVGEYLDLIKMMEVVLHGRVPRTWTLMFADACVLIRERSWRRQIHKNRRQRRRHSGTKKFKHADDGDTCLPDSVSVENSF